MMPQLSFDDFIQQRREQGQRELSRAMRLLTLEAAPEIAEVMHELTDDVFLEPRLFTFFTQPAAGVAPLGQVLFGALPPSLRPEAVEVTSDARGRVFVPKLGAFETAEAHADLMLSCDQELGTHALASETGPVAYTLTPPCYLKYRDIEVVRSADPALLACLRFNTDAAAEAEVVSDVEPFLANIAQALALIEHVCPRYGAELRACLRTIVLFRHPSANSFAALGAHGAVFFNVRWPATVPFFVDELLHQGGHVVFHAATTHRTELLHRPDQALRELTGEDDHRSLYDTLHGLYTEQMMSHVMNLLDRARLLSGDDAFELRGRLRFITRKYRTDLRNLGSEGGRSFTPAGLELYAFFRRSFDALVAARPELLAGDFSGHSYEFDAALYRAKNAGETMREPVGGFTSNDSPSA